MALTLMIMRAARPARACSHSREINSVSRARNCTGATPVTLTEAQKDAVLIDFELGAVAGFKQAAEFFETVRYHVLEGVFCEPQYGGNRDMIGWRLVNFPGQQFGYADAYVNKRVDLAPVAVDYSKVEEK